MTNLIDIEMINSSNFDYSQLEKNVAEKLQEIATNISATTNNMKYIIGEKLNEAQELLSKNGYGCFGEWIESYNLKRQTAYNFINYYKVFIQNLDKQKELEELADSKVYELGKLNAENQKKVLQEANLKEMSINEVKELTKQLKVEQEYSEELQEAIKQKDNQINNLKIQLEQTKIPEKEIIEKEVIKEVVPESIQNQVEQLEKEKSELIEKLNDAKSTIATLNNQKNNEKYEKYYDYGFDELSAEIASFLRNTSKYTYMEQEYLELSTSKKTLLKKGIKSIEEWLLNMKKAMNDKLMIGNDIYVEGEVEDE